MHHTAESIVKTKTLEDVGCGAYPCFYYINDEFIFVSVSVINLIKNLKSFKINRNFKPFKHYKGNMRKASLLKFHLEKLATKIINKISKGLIFHQHKYYPFWGTIDSRINRLKSFEKITISNMSCLKEKTFKHSILFKDQKTILEKSAKHIKEFINDIEKNFPEYENIVLTGGAKIVNS